MNIKFFNLRFLRRFAIPLLSRINVGDITIEHHYTNDRFRLHSFLHKGYWYHGKNREQAVMRLFLELIKPGQTVFDLGGHIGYISLHFANLVGETGKVVVFEPGTNNLPYIEANIRSKPNIELVKKVVSNTNGEIDFFIEELTGQNNTLLKNFQRFQQNQESAYVQVDYQQVIVESIRLDDFIEQSGYQPDFIKIDVEGAELSVLESAEQYLKKHQPGMMVEVNVKIKEVFDYLQDLGYVVFNSVTRLTNPKPADITDDNFFCLHPEKHEHHLQLLSIKPKTMQPIRLTAKATAS